MFVTGRIGFFFVVVAVHYLQYLLFGLCLLHHLSAHFDPRGENGAREVRHIDALQVTHLLSRWRDKTECAVKHT